MFQVIRIRPDSTERRPLSFAPVEKVLMWLNDPLVPIAVFHDQDSAMDAIDAAMQYALNLNEETYQTTRFIMCESTYEIVEVT